MANEFIPVNLSELENFAPVNLKQIGIRDYSDIKRQEVALAAAQKKQQLDPNRLPDTIEEYKMLFPTATPEQLQNYIYTKQEQAKQQQIDEVHQQGVFKNTSAMDYPVSFASGVIETASVIPLLGDMALRAATAGNYSLDELLEDTTGLPQNTSIKKDLQSALYDQLSEKAQLEDQEKQLKNELFNIRKDQRLSMLEQEGYDKDQAAMMEFGAEFANSLGNIGDAGIDSVAREIAKNLPNLFAASKAANLGAAATKKGLEKYLTQTAAKALGVDAAPQVAAKVSAFMASKAGQNIVALGGGAGATASMMAMEGSSNAQEAGQQIRELPSTELRATKGYQEMQKANPKMSEDDIRLALANKAEEITLAVAGSTATIPATLMGGFLGRTAAAPISKATIGSTVKATLEGGVRETLEETGQGFSGGISKNFAEEKVLNRKDFSEMSAKELLAGVGRETAESAVAGFGAGATFAGTAHGGKYLANKAGQAKDAIDDFQEQRTANKILTENSPAQKARMMEQEYTKSHKGNKDNVEAQVKSRQEFVNKIQPVMDQFDTELATREQALQTAQETQKQWEDKLATLNKDKQPDEFREASRAVKRGRSTIREATEALEYTTATQNRTRRLYEGILAAEIEDNTGLDVNTNPEQVILADNATPAMKKLAIQKILGIKTFGTHGTNEEKAAQQKLLNDMLGNPDIANDEDIKQRISSKLKLIQYYEDIQNGAAPDMTDANQDTVAQDILVGNERNKFFGVNEYILDIRGAIASKNKQVGNKLMRGLVNLRMSRDIKVDLASKIHAIAQNSPDDATFKQNAGKLIKEYQARFPGANGQLFNIHRNTFNTLLSKMRTERDLIVKAENELQQEAKAVFKIPLAAQAYSGTQRRFTPSEDTAESKQAQAEAQQAPVNQEEEMPVDEQEEAPVYDNYNPVDENEAAPDVTTEKVVEEQVQEEVTPTASEATAEAKQEDVIQQPDETPVQEQTEESVKSESVIPETEDSVTDYGKVKLFTGEVPKNIKDVTLSQAKKLLKKLSNSRLFKQLGINLVYKINKKYPHKGRINTSNMEQETIDWILTKVFPDLREDTARNGFYNLSKLQEILGPELSAEYANELNKISRANGKHTANSLLSHGKRYGSQKEFLRDVLEVLRMSAADREGVIARLVWLSSAEEDGGSTLVQYVWHYLDMFKTSHLVERALKDYGYTKKDPGTLDTALQRLSKDITKQAIAQKGKAYNTWKGIVNWMVDLLSNAEVKQILTDSFIKQRSLGSRGSFKYKDSTEVTKPELVKYLSQSSLKNLWMEFPKVFPNLPKMSSELISTIGKNIPARLVSPTVFGTVHAGPLHKTVNGTVVINVDAINNVEDMNRIGILVAKALLTNAIITVDTATLESVRKALTPYFDKYATTVKGTNPKQDLVTLFLKTMFDEDTRYLANIAYNSEVEELVDTLLTERIPKTHGFLNRLKKKKSDYNYLMASAMSLIPLGKGAKVNPDSVKFGLGNVLRSLMKTFSPKGELANTDSLRVSEIEIADLAQDQQEFLNGVQSFTKRFGDTFIEYIKPLSTGKNLIRNAVNYQPTSLFVDESGQFHPWFAEAVGLAAYEWLAISGPSTLENTLNDIRINLGKSKDAYLTPQEMAEQRFIGSQAEQVSERIGLRVLRNLGITFNTDTAAYQYHKDMARHIGEAALIVLSKTPINEQSTQPAVTIDKTKAKNIYGEDGRTVVRVEGITMRFVRANSLGAEAEGTPDAELDKLNKDIHTHMDLFESLTEQEMELTARSKPVKPYTEIDLGFRKASKKAVATINALNNSPYYIQQEMFKLYSAISESDVNDMIGMDNRPESKIHVDKRKGVHSRNLGIQRVRDKLAVQIESMRTNDKRWANGTDSPIYLNHTISSNDRFFVDSPLNPQTSKIIRQLLTKKERMSTIDISNSDNNDLNLFKFAVLEAFGEKVNKLTPAQVREKFDELLASPDTQEAIQEVRKALEDGATNVAAPTLARLSKSKENLWTTSAVLALSKYQTAVQSGATSFETDLYIQFDGTTNGYFFSIFLMALGKQRKGDRYETDNEAIHRIKEMAQKVGVFTKDSPYKTVNDYKQIPGNEDIYEERAKMFIDAIREIYADEPGVAEAIEQLFSPFDKPWMDANGATSSGRNLVKNAVTQLIYGAGPGGIALSIKEDAIDTLLDKFEQIASGEVDVSKKQEILEQLRVLAKLAPGVNSESLLTELAKANGDALLEMSLIPYKRLFATIFNHMRVDKETIPNVGGAVEQLIERQNPVMKANKDWMVGAVKKIFVNFAEKMQESINAVALDENGKIDPSRITEDKLMEIYNQHAAIAPIFHTANSEDISEGYSLVEFNKLNPTGDSVNEETGSVFEPNKGWKLLIAFSKNETRVVLHDGKTFDEGETGEGNKITPTDEWTHGLKPIVIKLPSVSIAPGLTISSDAATISTPLTEKAIVGVHDGIIMGINQASETGNLINDSAIEVITNYSSLESVLNRFKEIYSEEINAFYNDSEVKKDMEKSYISVSKALRERHPIGVQYHLGKQKVDMLKRLKNVFVPAIQYSSQYNPHIESGSHINESATDLPTAIPVSTSNKTKMNSDEVAAAMAELAARDADKNASLKPIPVSEEERKKTEEFWISWGVLSKEEGDLYDVIKAILKKTSHERTKEDDDVLYDSKNARVLAIVRSEMGSSQEGIDESLFNNSSEKAIDHNNVIEVFDGLANEGNVIENSNHADYLRSLISQIYLGSMGVLQMATETFGDTTKAVINLADKKIRMQLASKATMNTMMMGGIRMSAQQAYTHELTHNHMAYAIDNDTAVARQARLLFKKAEENVTWEDFITPGITPTAEEITMAKNTYDYIFRNEASIKESSMYLYQLSQNERNAYLHEFAAFGLTNENFIRKLKTIKLTRKDLVSDKVGATNKNVFTVLAEMITEHFNRLRLKLKGESLDATTDVHAELYRLAKELSETNEKHGFKVFEKIKEANEFTAKYTKAMAAAVWENDSKTVTAMKRGLEEYLLKTDEIEEFYRVTMNEITGSKPSHQVYEWIARINSKNLEQKPIHQSKHIAEVIEKQFAEGILTEQTRRAIHRALVVPDLSSLMVTGKDVMDKHFTWTKIKEILTDVKALDSEIAAIEAEIRKVANAHESNFIEAQAQSLGAFLATGMTTEQYTLRSLESIVSAHPALLGAASRLVSLQTLKYTDQQSKETLAGMIDTSQEALEFTINTHAALKAVALKRAPDNSKFRLKGALQDTLNHYKDIQVFSTATETPVKIQEKINRLTKLNYVKIREDKISFTNHKGESEVTTVQVYGSPFNPRSTFDTGAVAYRNPDKTNKDYVGSVNIRQEINAQRANGKKNSVPKHHTIVDNRGNIATAHLMYSVGEETLRTNLDKQENFSRTLGQLGAVVSSEITTVKANRFLSKEWAKEIKENMAKESGKYLVIPVGEDAIPSTIPLYKKVQKEYMLLPPHLKAAMLEDGIVDDNGNLTIHREAIKLLFAQSRLSPLNLEYKQKDIDEDRATEYMGKLVNNALYHLLYNKPGMYAFRGWEETVSFAKGTIVIKGMEVLINNITSNNISLLLLGVGFKDLIKWQHEGYYYAKEYQFLKKQATQMELEMKMDTKKNTKEARIQLSRLKNRIASNPTRELFELGAFSAISEEIYTLNEDSPFKGLMEEQIEKITEHNPLNEKMTKAFKIATLQRGTIGYQAMMDLTQMSDFVARYVLWKHLTERKGMKKEQAIQEVMDTFVMYDTVTNKWIQLGNDIGLIMFTKFWLRTQRVIKKVAVENPVYLALYLFSQYMFFDTTDILDSFLFNMPEVNTPWGVVSAVVTEQPLVKLLF